MQVFSAGRSWAHVNFWRRQTIGLYSLYSIAGTYWPVFGTGAEIDFDYDAML